MSSRVLGLWLLSHDALVMSLPSASLAGWPPVPPPLLFGTKKSALCAERRERAGDGWVAGAVWCVRLRLAAAHASTD